MVLRFRAAGAPPPRPGAVGSVSETTTSQETYHMQFAGFADEVSVDIDQQISALRALGWPGIEIRLVGKGRHFDDVTDAEFEVIREKLARAGIRIVAYGSQIANWSRKISGRG
jgi:hypothetical protein